MDNLSSDQRDALIRAALDVRAHAHAPYSKFPVGAALLTKSGALFTGVNVENASWGMTICAERSAVFAAVTAGEREFIGLAIALRGGGTPCGACRQVLAEFVVDLPVFLVDSEDASRVEATSLSALLPKPFGPAHLGID